jgi:hypothetical protein
VAGVVSGTEHQVRRAIENALPADVIGTVRKIQARRGWGNALVVEVRTVARRNVEYFRTQMLSAIGTATGEARIVLKITDR